MGFLHYLPCPETTSGIGLPSLPQSRCDRFQGDVEFRGRSRGPRDWQAPAHLSNPLWPIGNGCIVAGPLPGPSTDCCEERNSPVGTSVKSYRRLKKRRWTEQFACTLSTKLQNETWAINQSARESCHADGNKLHLTLEVPNKSPHSESRWRPRSGRSPLCRAG
jgi:hypothetical protein